MIEALRKFLKGRPQPASGAAQVPAGQRVYAVGDVHGCADLFAALGAAIDGDDAARGPAHTTVILLGDLVDRGPDSAGVIDRAMAWGKRRPVRVITGNHEEVFLRGLDDAAVFRTHLRIGGNATILSYPVDPVAFTTADHAAAQAMARDAVPQAHRDFLTESEDQVRIGDYLFVHAGIDPALPLDAQRVEDLRWIREPFLTSADDHGCVIVHGHTITTDAVVRPNRIGIDTGAFMSGRLTALGLEGDARWLIEADQQDDGTICTRQRAL